MCGSEAIFFTATCINITNSKHIAIAHMVVLTTLYGYRASQQSKLCHYTAQFYLTCCPPYFLDYVYILGLLAPGSHRATFHVSTASSAGIKIFVHPHSPAHK